MTTSFTNKRAIVCGGSRGIGRAIALGLARSGAHVSICARSPAALETTANNIRASGGRAHFGVCDLAKADDIATYIASAVTALGGLDILVNNASGFGMADDEAGWAAGLSIDIMATVRASHAAIPHLEQSPSAAIVNIASISGYGASVRSAPYAAVKAAIINYTQSQALALAPKRIRVNGIAPGSIEFPGGLWAQRKTDHPQLYAATLRSIPWGRYGKPEEVASVALFLASEAAGWVTGQTLIVDGGQSL
jgi:3-oxoacyl-[acyl-carrier protein] reductase